MLGCIGSREKPLPPSSLEPYAVRGVSRGPDHVTFEFGLQAVGDARVSTDCATCSVQSLEAGTLQSTWVTLPNTTWQELAPEAATGAGRGSSAAGGKAKHVRCLAVVPSLQAEKDYTFRLLARGSPKEQSAFSAPFVVRTSDRPKLDGVALLCSRRWADSIEVEWPLADPDGAPIQECLAQCRPDSLMSSWLPEAPLKVVECGTDTEGGCRHWRGRLIGLTGAAPYRVCARARNAVGWSQAFSPELTCYTSDLPHAPKGLLCLRRQPNSVTVWMMLEDPEGAPVQSCSVQIHGVLGYSLHPQSRFLRVEPAAATLSGGPGKVTRSAMCIVDGLQPETEYHLRLWVQNASGSARQPSLPLQVFTSERPRPPTEFTIKVGPRVIEVEWELTDPVGAPVVACELEYSKDSVFSSWQAFAAEPVAVVGATTKSEESASLDAVVLLAQAMAVAPVARLWRLRIDGLERETAYALRVRARNSVGWSSSSHVERTATSDRPCSPHGLRCVARLPAAVRLELSVPEVLGTAPVSQIHIERSGSFSWQELQEVEVTRAETATPGFSHWSVLVTLGVDPAVTHRLRAWASNDFGRCSEPSPVCACRTSDRPSPLPALECIQRLPHAVVLRWAVPDPEGAPIWRFEIKCRRDQALASWQTAVCTDTTRCQVDPDRPGEQHQWRCAVEQLDPDSAYRLCARACNEVGWSEWFVPEAAFQTSGLPPSPSSLAVHGVVDTSAAGAGAEQGYLMVNLELPDPEGAPVVACMVKCHPHTVWTLCRREGRSSPGRWRSRLPWECRSQDKASLAISVRSANAVGWSQHEESAALAAAGADSSAGSEASAVELVFGQVKEDLEAQQLARGRLAALSAQATARGDHEHAALIARHRVEAEKRMEVLQEVEQQVGSALSSCGEDQGTVLVSQLNQALQRHRLVPNPSAAAKILSLLLRGYMWLETSWRSELKSLSSGIAQAMEATASGGRILMQWAKQHQAWSQSFDDKVSATLPEGLACAVQLLTTLASGRKLESFESVRGDLSACLTLVAAAERQLKRLRMSHRVLHAAEAASCHDFEQKGLLRKIESTALGIVTMMVLPLPGSIEVGTLGIGMMWLEGDAANSHLALQHPTGVPLAPVLQRLGSCPPPRAAVILAGWASGGHGGVFLVHNATPRRITVTASPEKGATLASKAYERLQDAHLMVKIVGNAMSESDGGDHVATILPTDLALIQVPDDAAASWRLEFCYGTAAHAEKAVGWAVVRPGSALSFVRLDGGLQVSNVEGENASVEEGTVRLVNNDLAPVSVSIFRAPEHQKHFEGALLTEALESSEEKRLPLPKPCTGRIYQLEVRYENKQKALCEVRAGQCVTIEGCV